MRATSSASFFMLLKPDELYYAIERTYAWPPAARIAVQERFEGAFDWIRLLRFWLGLFH
jgi:hypothetical protein